MCCTVAFAFFGLCGFAIVHSNVNHLATSVSVSQAISNSAFYDKIVADKNNKNNNNNNNDNNNNIYARFKSDFMLEFSTLFRVIYVTKFTQHYSF